MSAHGGLVLRRIDCTHGGVTFLPPVGQMPDLLGVLVLDEAGQGVEVVVAFTSPASAATWCEAHGVAAYRLMPARLIQPRRP